MFIKKVIGLVTLVFLSSLMTGCSSEWKLVEDSSSVGESFKKYLEESPINIQSSHKYYSNIPYGQSEQNVFDLWVSESDKPGPLIVYIHGGGFQGGDKSSAWNQPSKFGIGPEQISDFLGQGFSFASINYRLLQKTDKEGVLKCLNDSKRAIQFLRYHSSELDINAKSIGLVGTSAGAGTALWIGFHDEMAEATSDDPVSRQSTRVQAIAAQETQSTYDILRWSEDVFPNGIFTMNKIRGTALGNRLMVFYGIDDFNQLESDRIVKYRKEVDMLSMVDSEDPPVYILNKKDFKPDDGNRVGNLLHSPYHAVALRKVLTEAGLSGQIFIPAEGSKPNQSAADFLIEHLK